MWPFSKKNITFTTFDVITTDKEGETRIVKARRYPSGMILIPKISGFEEGNLDGTIVNKKSYIESWKEIK